ncbi:P22 phage major capsid protein family protein [Galactobacter sp.]|uniref:P22 phage major capsid protein family protein n=1 Tax=Galactobacter sp. TaxID=2676125 RepID=UPI0025C4C4B8|nr:P22 phage major capsid protein family protein [Galactobacter sp.]
MAHQFLKPEVIGNAALGLIKDEVILPNLVYRDAETHYQGQVGPRGDTVQIPIRGSLGDARELAWRDASRQIVTDEIKDGTVSIKLDTYLYKAVGLLREEQTLDIADYGAQVLSPMTNSVAYGAEKRIAAAIEGAPYVESIDLVDAERGTYNALVDARKFLRKHGVPRDGLVAIAGTEAVARALKDPTLIDANRSGSDSTLREAAIGRIAGFDLFESDVIDDDSIYLFHPTAFPTVFRAPAPARSVPFSASVSGGGIAMSYWESLNSQNDSDRAFLGTFFGVNTYSDPVDGTDPTGDKEFVRAVRIQGPNAEEPPAGE